MRNNWRSKLSVLAGASALAVSAVTATPALADEAPETLVEVQLPTGTSVIEGSATAPGAEPGDLLFPADEDEAVAAGKANPVASAKAGPSNTCLGGVAAYGVQGCFQHNGDIVWSGDTKKDGMSSAVGVYTDYGRAAEVCVNKLGVNTWATCNKDYRESGNVRLRVLRYDGDTGKFYQPESWSGWIPVDGKY